MHVADQFLRHSAVARAVQLAERLAAPVRAIEVDIVGAWQEPGATAIGDLDGVLLHLRLPPQAPAERAAFLDGVFAGWVTAALRPVAGAV